MRKTIQTRFRWALTALALLAAPSALFAQACPLCYQSVSAASSQFIAALKNGIFALLFPSMFVIAAISLLTYRKRNDFGEDEPPQPPSSRSI
jgi:hypothetical protein